MPETTNTISSDPQYWMICRSFLSVNTAARMEQHGEPGSINISESSYELVKDEFVCTRRDKIAARHKGEVEMYFVNAAVAKGAL